jgi:uncharacterized integral membrane protein
MRTARKLLGVLLLLLLAAFVLFNLETASVWFFIGKLEMPLGIVVLISAGLGAATTVLLGLLKRSRGSH